MKVHKMSNKQFAKFVSDLQKQAMKNPLHLSFRFTDKYDYECKQGYFLCDADWIIRANFVAQNSIVYGPRMTLM